MKNDEKSGFRFMLGFFVIILIIGLLGFLVIDLPRLQDETDMEITRTETAPDTTIESFKATPETLTITTKNGERLEYKIEGKN